MTIAHYDNRIPRYCSNASTEVLNQLAESGNMFFPLDLIFLIFFIRTAFYFLVSNQRLFLETLFSTEQTPRKMMALWDEALGLSSIPKIFLTNLEDCL